MIATKTIKPLPRYVYASFHALIIVSILAGIFAAPNCYSAPVTLSAQNIHWTKVEYSTSLFLISLTADVSFSKVKSAEVLSQFYNPKDKPFIMPKGEELLLLTMNSDNFGRKSTVDFWFEPDLTGLQIKQIDTGRKNYVRTYRFAKDGVYRRDTNPRQEEVDLPWNRWSDISYHEYPHPQDIDTTRLTDNAVIFYVATAANFANPGDSFTVDAFDKKHLNRITMTVEGKSEIAVDYYEYSAGASRHIEDTIEALRISIIPTPLGKNVDKNEFEFLGLKEDIKLYIDPKTRIPLQVSSRVRVLGTVNITLNRVQLM